jgi:hypothetical protein
MSASHSAPEFRLAMGPVARALRGEPNASLSTKNELRFGSRGSLSVDLRKGCWADHETGESGGALDFVKRETRTDQDGALDYLVKAGHIAPPDPDYGIVAKHDYYDENGELLFQVVRKAPKKFLQRRPDKQGGWIWKIGDARRVIYRLPEIIAAVAADRTIYVVEGEKDVHALERMGLVATTNPGGAGKWRADYSKYFLGADVIIIPDNDDVGEKHAKQVQAALRHIADRVRVLVLPGLPDKGDFSDWVDAGGTRADLEAMVPVVQAANVPLENQQICRVSGGGTSDQNDQKSEHLPAARTRSADKDKDAAPNLFKPDIDAVVAEFNALYMLVNEAGKAVVYQPGYDPVLKRRTFDRLATRDLLTLYMNRQIQTGTDDKDRPVYTRVASLWLHSADRRQFIHGVTFDPTSSRPKPGVLNLWEGFAIKPKAGDWSLMRDHISTIICAGDAVRFDYLMGWMARMLQNPAEQGEVATIMQGGEGIGKGTLAKALMTITGHHGLAISNSKHLVGNFNAHLRDVIFLFADEALFAGDRSHVGTLKSLITEPYLTVEGKFQNAVQSPNFLHVMMASNEQWVVPASHDSRRYFVLEVSDARAGDHAYFAAIWQQMEAGGYQAMLHDLLAMDLRGFNVRAVPVTDGLHRQRKLSLGTTEGWWLDCLERGYVFASKIGLEADFAVWHPKISTELLFASYLEFAKSHGERRPLSREGLGRFLAGLGATPIRWRSGVVGEHMADVPTPYGSTRKAELVRQERTCGYHVGHLDKARAEFSNKTGVSVTWDNGAPEQAAAE